MMEVARLGNKFLADTEPWKLIKTDQARVGTILNLSLQIAANLAILSKPFLPQTSEKLCGILHADLSEWSQAGSSTLLLPGHQLEKATLLFEKIEDEQIEKQVAKLAATKPPMEADTNNLEAAKASINFDEFMAMDIRIGTILEAEAVPKSKKLLKLKVDTGIDQRTVVSGIAQHYNPHEIVGQQVTVLVNLAPRKIMGIESQGMILMSEDSEGVLAFLQPDKSANPGSQVS